MNIKLISACAAIAAGMAMTACGCGDKCEAADDTTVCKATSDSISETYGLMVGSMINGELRYYAAHEDNSYDPREFVKGMQSVLGTPKEDAYLAGVNAAIRISADLHQLQEQGVKVDRSKLMEALRKTILADSVGEAEGNEYATQYRRLLEQVQQKAQKRDEARKNLSPEAQQNARTGAAFVAKAIKEDPNVNAIDGMGVRVDRTGAGSVLRKGDRALVNVRVMRPNGQQVMQSDSTVLAVSQGEMPDALFTGLTVLAKGGKATVYAPGEKAFGVNGIPQSNIGPNEAMIFEIEVLEVNPTPGK